MHIPGKSINSQLSTPTSLNHHSCLGKWLQYHTAYRNELNIQRLRNKKNNFIYVSSDEKKQNKKKTETYGDMEVEGIEFNLTRKLKSTLFSCPRGFE